MFCSLSDMACQISFLLIVTGLTGIDSVTKVSQVSVKTGGSISIPCLYEPQYRENVKYLCKGYYWNHCSYSIKSNQENSQKYSISDDKDRSVFTVMINNLTHEDTYYWCAVEINAGTDIGEYFHLSVTTGMPSLYVDHQKLSAMMGKSITIKCSHNNPGSNKWCRLGGSCVTMLPGLIDGTSVTISGFEGHFTVTMSGLKPENSGWYLCVRGDFQMPVHLTVTKEHVTNPATTVSRESRADGYKIIITLSILIALVTLTLFTWFLFNRYKKRQELPTAAMDEEEVTYSVVRYERKKSSKVQAKDEDVIYSSLSQQMKSL